ncbi:ATP-binding cassette domain-containing protein [Streptomyces sp. EKR5.2]|uniref:ATP-binding cassette domain-containing protein n=1 Tax=Streptomyces sp. EKR5.2 TaxID=3461014 RepID=UPI004041DBA8
MRPVSAAETAPTLHPWRVHARELRVRAGRHLAVDGLDLALKAGVHGLLGPNGAGKTTLMRALSTVVKPAGGSLTLLGAQVDGRADLREVRRGRLSAAAVRLLLAVHRPRVRRAHGLAQSWAARSAAASLRPGRSAPTAPRNWSRSRTATANLVSRGPT